MFYLPTNKDEDLSDRLSHEEFEVVDGTYGTPKLSSPAQPLARKIQNLVVTNLPSLPRLDLFHQDILRSHLPVSLEVYSDTQKTTDDKTIYNYK
ncbi:hypothetical protein O181_006102 [Austropuccinia psidii MF-1]|uniref:Uncharacterized protein n=1 Tax=Austropuccinia psidii MF-1 TaxID=1389203 RepID=A0A9Q3BJE5_9BASI|nr:hypothetical protein [Austropuccinia psidii MF-1]